MNFRKVVLVVAVLGVAAFGLYYLLSARGKSAIMILEPEYLVYKKKPDDPGGIVAANAENFVYENLKRGSAKVASNKSNNYIVPEPEKPLDIIYNQTISGSNNGEDGEQPFDSIDSILMNLDSYEETTLPASSETASDSDHAMPNLSPSQQAASVDVQKQEEMTNIHGIQIIKAPAQLAKLPKIKAFATDAGGYKLQLTVASSEKEAKAAWDNISSRYGKILQDASMVIRKAKGKNDRIFFLVMAGTYSSLPQAKLVCKKLSAKKQNCIITK